MDELRREFIAQAIAWAPSVGVALALLVFFGVLARLARFAVLRVVRRRRDGQQPLAQLLASVAHVSLTALGIVTALGTLGVNIMGLVAGLGLTGFALGFALKDSIANLLAGVMILLYRPFEPGDRIEVAGLSGRVVYVDLRYTELDNERERILVPNSKMLTDPIRVAKPPAQGAG
ncbi:MAG TPA: mechanosensitive ion channel domain-containing protein [Burkholderiales bacterium]